MAHVIKLIAIQQSKLMFTQSGFVLLNKRIKAFVLYADAFSKQAGINTRLCFVANQYIVLADFRLNEALPLYGHIRTFH
ncbi:hypothetical protein ACSBIB_004618 [Escherichia coli]